MSSKREVSLRLASLKCVVSGALLFLLAACGNPGGISDSDYASYEELGAPKVLYSCTREGEMDFVAYLQECTTLADPREALACSARIEREGKEPIVDVGYSAGVGIGATYNSILQDAKADCDGVFKILESDQ